MIPNSTKLFRTGTLTYTKSGLFVLSLWLLWGDFAFSFFESVFSRFIPIYLKDLEASNTLIGVMTGSFAGLVNVLFLPGISRWSDNFRSRIGRRIPFLYVVTPLTVGFLVAIGFAPEIGAWIHSQLPPPIAASISKGALILGFLCAFAVGFHFFNMILVNSYNWLIRDVVPLEVMSRFLAWFRIVGTVSTVFFLWFVFPHLLTHRKEICLGIGLFYLVAFLLMCRRVKEGEYPPPISQENRPGVLKMFVIYFRECLQVPLYRHFFLAYLLVIAASQCAGSFHVLFVKDTLGINMDEMGRIFSYTAAVSALFFFPIGWLCDRFTPIQVTLTAIITMSIGAVLGLALVQNQATYLIYALAMQLPSVGWQLGSMATTMKLFPSEKFGQFSGALNVFGCGALIVGNILIGLLMDFFQSNYRMAFLWTAIFTAAAIFPMLLVFRGWKIHGGRHGYVPPLPTPP